jgi:restriction system protein
MGSLSFYKGTLVDHLHEIIGCKAGLAASLEQICDLMSDTGFVDDIRESETKGLRLRSEEYESLYYDLLHKFGVTPRRVGPGSTEMICLCHELDKEGGIGFGDQILSVYVSEVASFLRERGGCGALDAMEMIERAAARYGTKGIDAILRVIELQQNMATYHPFSGNRVSFWDDVRDLSDLFDEFQPSVTHGVYFDQRFINYLSVNYEQLGAILWRKFEELTSEYFLQAGFKVEIGAGSNDDGVDVRVWADEEDEKPEYVIQCKRQSRAIDKVTIKGLYADLLEERAGMGLLVTTSEFSPGARKTVRVRGYPIKEINREKIRLWLADLRTPGSGIVRV